MQAEELLQAIVSGDEKAFRQFYYLFKDRVYNTCLAHLQNASDAEEITQDVFVDIYRRAAEFKGTAAVSTWVYRITVNKCIDRMRYNGRQRRFAFITSLFSSKDGSLMHDPGDFIHPGVLAENKERSRLLFAAIRKLPLNQQTAFILKQVEGLSQKEVASAMELSEKAVESLIQRAKGNLRNVLGEIHQLTKDNKKKND